MKLKFKKLVYNGWDLLSLVVTPHREWYLVPTFFSRGAPFACHTMLQHSTWQLIVLDTLDMLWILSLLCFILGPLIGLKTIVWPYKTCLSETDGKEVYKKRKLNYFIIAWVRICVWYCIWANGKERNLLSHFGLKVQINPSRFYPQRFQLFELSDENRSHCVCGGGRGGGCPWYVALIQIPFYRRLSFRDRLPRPHWPFSPVVSMPSYKARKVSAPEEISIISSSQNSLKNNLASQTS